jgi:hypothetical protein
MRFLLSICALAAIVSGIASCLMPRDAEAIISAEREPIRKWKFMDQYRDPSAPGTHLPDEYLDPTTGRWTALDWLPEVPE